MRLIIKIALIYGVISLLVFLPGGMITYQVMSTEIEFEEQRFLLERLPHVERYIERRNPTDTVIRDKMIIVPFGFPVAATEPIYSDTIVMHSSLLRLEPHTKMDVVREINGRSYKITLYDLIVEQDDIEDAVREAMIKLYVLLFAAVLILSFFASFFVFKSFRATLEFIKNFSIKDQTPIKLPRSSTKEFKKLNQFIEEMTLQVRNDYQALKEFSENASHEIQTPLSIVTGKLELLLSYPNLDENQLELIISAQNALKRLSKTSQSLALLTKIDNREFSNFSEVDFSKIAENILSEFKELVELKSIRLEAEIEKGIVVKGNKVLLEILVSNLLNNAVRHNKANGFIRLFLDEKGLTVENSGVPLEGNPNDLFKRFRKGSEDPESSGLGLSIVKKICNEHRFQVDYFSENELHRLTVKLNTNVTF